MTRRGKPFPDGLTRPLRPVPMTPDPQMLARPRAPQGLRAVVARLGVAQATGGQAGTGQPGARALLHGQSATERLHAAERVAAELGRDLLRVDLDAVVGKYIGETETNLDRVFRSAEEAGAVLLLDEADAVMGRRTEVKEAHDRYASVDASMLAGRLQTFRGPAIVTAGVVDHIDPAIAHAMDVVIDLAEPEEP